MTINAASRTIIIAASGDGIRYSKHPTGDAGPSLGTSLFSDNFDAGVLTGWTSSGSQNGGTLTVSSDTAANYGGLAIRIRQHNLRVPGCCIVFDIAVLSLILDCYAKFICHLIFSFSKALFLL